jgi:hypothetical protein
VRDLGRSSIEDKPSFYFTGDGWPDYASVPVSLPDKLRVFGSDDVIRALIESRAT